MASSAWEEQREAPEAPLARLGRWLSRRVSEGLVSRREQEVSRVQAFSICSIQQQPMRQEVVSAVPVALLGVDPQKNPKGSVRMGRTEPSELCSELQLPLRLLQLRCNRRQGTRPCRSGRVRSPWVEDTAGLTNKVLYPFKNQNSSGISEASFFEKAVDILG